MIESLWLMLIVHQAPTCAELSARCHDLHCNVARPAPDGGFELVCPPRSDRDRREACRDYEALCGVQLVPEEAPVSAKPATRALAVEPTTEPSARPGDGASDLDALLRASANQSTAPPTQRAAPPAKKKRR